MTKLKPFALSLLAAALLAVCSTTVHAEDAMRVLLAPVMVSR